MVREPAENGVSYGEEMFDTSCEDECCPGRLAFIEEHVAEEKPASVELCRVNLVNSLIYNAYVLGPDLLDQESGELLWCHVIAQLCWDVGELRKVNSESFGGAMLIWL